MTDTNEARVDVLAVMDEVLARYEHGETLSPMPSGKRVADARAAVAELVDRADAVAEMLEGMKERGVTIPNESRLTKLRVALARMGVQS